MAPSEHISAATLPAALAQRATRDPERLFLLGRDARLTFGEADSQAEAMAAALHGLGVQPGDRVALLLPPCVEFAVATFAAARLGAVVVPLDPRLPGPELQYLLRHSEAVAAVMIETFEGVDYLQLFEGLLPHLPELHYLVTVGEADLWYDDRIFQYEDLLSSGQGRDYPAPPGTATSPDQDVFGLLYTSGTTGKPKGVLLTHGNLVRVAAAAVERLGIGPDDRVVGVNALFHVFGLGQGLVGSVVAGSTLVLDPAVNGPTTLDLIEKHRATVEYGTPTLFETQIIEQAERPRDLSSLRLALIAGAPVPPTLPERIEAGIGATVVVGYSVTETGGLVCVSEPGADRSTRHFTVGLPLEGVRVRIIPDASVPDGAESPGSELPAETVGEIAIGGVGVMHGYYRQPRLTSRSLDPDGSFLAGDLGMLDDSGSLHLVGRHREVIIRAGHNVHPREVENRLAMHPAVHEVAVVGLPDAILGELICACVVPVEGAIVTEDELKEWCRATLADHRIPDLVRLFEAFPMTGTGKIRRVEVARLLRESVRTDT
ncbi:MAG: AMP-binding protein [Longimicrobiales bacterium]|nr:AMP-binding protein [Longimicrobiales bacterium]